MPLPELVTRMAVSGIKVLIAWFFAYGVTWLARGNAWPPGESWGLRWERVKGDWLFWVVMFLVLVGTQPLARMLAHEGLSLR